MNNDLKMKLENNFSEDQVASVVELCENLYEVDNELIDHILHFIISDKNLVRKSERRGISLGNLVKLFLIRYDDDFTNSDEKDIVEYNVLLENIYNNVLDFIEARDLDFSDESIDYICRIRE